MSASLSLAFFFSIVAIVTEAQIWVPDLGDGKYKNPVLYADYSDPDVCRVGDDFYLTASSFNAIPGLPILHSKDLVNWKIIGHALKEQQPSEVFDKPQHGNGVWAPAIRYHNNEFYIYYPDPDYGIYLVKAKTAAGPWSEPILVEGGKGLIDPCPLWDESGNYLVHAYANSRAGIKSILIVKKLNTEGTKTIDGGKIVFDGHVSDPTVEGPKFYKRNGYYYIFAPAGGVATGWQLALRSKNVYGPYERKIVLDQGTTAINGPHQGAWVDTATGEDWFVHFQDKGPYGRVVHLQPMLWKDNWPVMGEDKDGDGKGEPVLTFNKPNVSKSYFKMTPAEGDEFNAEPGLQWQWQANSKAAWSVSEPAAGVLRLYSIPIPSAAKNFWEVPNLLLQKFPAEEFTVTTKFNLAPRPGTVGEQAGLVVMGQSYARISLVNKKDGIWLVYSSCKDAVKGAAEEERIITKSPGGSIHFRVSIWKGAVCHFSYSLDGIRFENIKAEFTAVQGKWIGAKVGIFCTGTGEAGNPGYGDFDWFRVTK